ncbi:integrase arm-type DNA-binding domain-containing protein [Roseomonas mucosa]|uniref:tyrosine-type recombinase/integrase n=1 Tax=Roseomonas mucosa TaxID=207340 RepID=UPI00208FF7B8|nr:integrase arm-type DNA-binding domain-containing protein [Roseomonas mucosa]MDT8274967.1 integrase arm-type DNA-binding domain-containing protein [Roseomonas mucosa]USQ70698.1 integrase arm-type DNA-binding domain-containing protein [Roseomonas mucosa]
MTAAWVAKVEPQPGKRLEFGDTVVPGLELRVTENGAFSWAARKRIREGERTGQFTRIGLGSYPAMGLAAARKAARAALGKIVAGHDPNATRKAAKAKAAALAAEKTLKARLAEWQAAKEGDWSPRYAAEVERICRKEIEPTLGKKILSAVTVEDWSALVAKKRKATPAAAATLFRVVSSFTGHAEVAGWGAVPLPRKAGAVLAPAVDPRGRLLSDKELAAIWHGAEKLSPKPRCFVRLLILTGARREEVAGIVAGEVDREAGTWTVPGSRTKNGKPITRPLCPLALAELALIWPEKCGPSYGLLGSVKGGTLSGFSGIKRRLDSASKVKGWRVHDLRRACRSTLAKLHVPQDHAEAALGHISGRSSLVKTYDQHDYAAEIIAALNLWQGHVAALVAPGKSAKILSIKAA